MIEDKKAWVQYEWIRVAELRAGDFVVRWGDELEVVGSIERGNQVVLTVIETDGANRDFHYGPDAEVKVRRRREQWQQKP